MIRIKVKTLALGLAGLFLLSAVAYLAMPSVLYKMQKYDAVLTYFPNSKEAPEALYWAAETMVPFPGQDHLLFVFPTASSYSHGERNSKRQLAYAEKLLERLLSEYPDYRHAGMARWKLADLYMVGEKWDEAEKLYREIAQDDSTYGERRKTAKMHAAMLASRHVRPDAAPSVTGSVQIGDAPAADAYAVLRRKGENVWHSPPFGYYPMALTDRDGTFRFYDVAPGEYEIGIGLRKEKVDGYYLAEPANQTVVVTEGTTAEYDVRFVPQVKVVNPTNKETIAEDVIRFEWEPYPGADYYKLTISAIDNVREGESYDTFPIALEDTWREPYAEYGIETLRTVPRGYGKTSDGEGRTQLSPAAILGAVYPGGKFVWCVDAYDSDGLKISSSSGYYTSFDNNLPFFSLDDKEQLKGDKLVVEGKYEEAMQTYETELHNPYALRALAIMHLHGITMDDEGDPQTALSYLRQIPHPSPFDRELMRETEARARESDGKQN